MVIWEDGSRQIAVDVVVGKLGMVGTTPSNIFCFRRAVAALFQIGIAADGTVPFNIFSFS